MLSILNEHLPVPEDPMEEGEEEEEGDGQDTEEYTLT
jgi:hypothetical protein